MVVEPWGSVLFWTRYLENHPDRNFWRKLYVTNPLDRTAELVRKQRKQQILRVEGNLEVTDPGVLPGGGWLPLLFFLVETVCTC